MNKKRANLPEFKPIQDNLSELVDRYLPLHELKMSSKVEGIEIGLEQAARE